MQNNNGDKSILIQSKKKKSQYALTENKTNCACIGNSCKLFRLQVLTFQTLCRLVPSFYIKKKMYFVSHYYSKICYS